MAPPVCALSVTPAEPAWRRIEKLPSSPVCRSPRCRRGGWWGRWSPGGPGQLQGGRHRGWRRRSGRARAGVGPGGGVGGGLGSGCGGARGGSRPDSRSGRARRSDRMTTTSGLSGDDVQLVTFKVGGQDFAFNIFQVERILRYEAPAPLPKAPEFLEGVLQYQGGAIPLVDLRKRLGAAAPLREDTRTVILEIDGGKIGMIVDTATGAIQVAGQAVTPPPGIVKGLAAEYISGLVVQNGRTIVGLNTNKLLNAKG